MEARLWGYNKRRAKVGDAMKIPKEIKILGVPWAVKQKTYLKLAGEKVSGACHYDIKEIHLERKLPKDILEKTYLHELMHAFLNESSLDEPLNLEYEETLVESLSKFVHILLTSKDLVE